MRAVGAIVLYALAAIGGLSVGYLATGPRSEERERAREVRAAERRDQAELSEMEAAAAFLADQERRATEPTGLEASL
jgi:hypothetical protein